MRAFWRAGLRASSQTKSMGVENNPSSEINGSALPRVVHRTVLKEAEVSLHLPNRPARIRN